ncbi:hypothetical protein [Paenibacillus sp.]|uniref:hypothetical protein n=1 Tax=Paenibacillus sp. TaxID=58172 RepID=UPI002D5CE4CB|nr:hypothetical protein [Paenibacillus sp.]HZG86662.1 hypothetical protein [Paenibacillus sp.]
MLNNRLLARYAAGWLAELLMLLPVGLALHAWLASLGAAQAAALPALSFAGAAVGFRWRRVWQRLLAAAAAGAAAAYALADGPAAAAAWAAAGGFAALQGATTGDRMGAVKRHFIGLALYFAAAVAFPRLGALEETVPLLTAGGLLALAVALFAANGAFLRDAALSPKAKPAVPGALRRHNALIVGAVLLAAALLTAAFGNAFGRLLYAALRGLFGLLPDGAPAAPPAQEPPPPAAAPQLPGGAEEPGPLAAVWNALAYAVAALALIALVAAAGLWLYRHFGPLAKEWLKRLAAFLGRSAREPEPAGYTDEETVVFSWDTALQRWRTSRFARLIARRREERWEELASNRDRVRFLYRSWLRSAVESGYAPRRELTPAETAADLREWAEAVGEGRGKRRAAPGLPPALLALYYRVRYGEADAGDAETEAARRELRERMDRGS